ncbi:MAG: SpoIID/LytB domain-containing protein [Clostridia bacterium]|nr:SpoIID/LytB domain-containing protein [Clostridia bacterium]
MKVRLLSLNIDKNMPFARYQARVVSSIKAYSSEVSSFEESENLRDLFGSLQDALENDELIVVAVDNSHYIKLKNALIQALETETVYNSAILNMLESDEEMDDNTRKAFSLFPELSTVFLSKDGMYSGFGIENGTQFLLMIPIDNDRINMILRNGVVPFLSKHIEVTNDDEFLGEKKLFENEKVAIAVNRIVESGSVAAVSGTPNAEIVKSCGDNVVNFDEVFMFTPYVEDKGDVNATEYAAQLAKVSIDLSAANIGASISDIYTANETKFICIAVANDESAVVRKLYMSENESEAEFIEAAAIELIELIGEKAAGVQSIGIEITEDNSNKITDEDKKPLNKKSVFIISLVLGMVVVLCAVLGIVYKVQGENGALANMLNKIFNNTTTTTEPQTSAPVIEVKLSDFMISDLIKIEMLKNMEETTEDTESTTGDESTTESTTEPTTEVDVGAPTVMKINGEEIEAKEALGRLVMTEMGEGYNIEAVKAQAVVIYTYLKYRDTNFEIDGVKISDTVNEEVQAAVDSVFGEYLTFKGEVALTPYFEIAAKKTTSAEGIFSKEYSYLKPISIAGEPDAAAESYKVERKYSMGEFKGLLLNYDSELTLGDKPIMWVTVDTHDASISSSIGYVTKVTVGGKEISGLDFRTKVFTPSTLLSHCFTVDYNEATSEFLVTSYGNGLGVGMSKTGANHLADKKASYKKILSTYFNGTVLTQEKNV